MTLVRTIPEQRSYEWIDQRHVAFMTSNMFSRPTNFFSSNQDHGRVSRRKFIANLAAAGICMPALAQLGCAARPASQMRLACQTNAWPFESGLAGLIPVLRTIKSLGFQGYETSYRNVQEAFSDPKPARAQLEETGLTCAGVHIAGTSLYEPDTGIPSLDFLQKIAAGSSALGAEYLILSGRGVAEVNGKLDQDALKRKITALLEYAQYCHDVGLTLAYHNHADDLILDGAEIDELLAADRRDLVGVWFCLNNAQRAGVPVANYFSGHHESITGIHLTNIYIDSPGEHRLDDEPLLKEIQKADWKGWLVIEEERTRDRRDWPETPAVTKARQHVSQVFGI
jgi:sugar phosphate isomerase/epimerase